MRENQLLSYYDVHKEVTIEIDSSEVGLEVVLTHDGRPVVYTYRSLTKTEHNYTQIAKQCLSIVYASQQFEQYILGKENVEVLKDHNLLMSIGEAHTVKPEEVAENVSTPTAKTR